MMSVKYFRYAVLNFILPKNQLHAVSRTQRGWQREHSVKTLRFHQDTSSLHFPPKSGGLAYRMAELKWESNPQPVPTTSLVTSNIVWLKISSNSLLSHINNRVSIILNCILYLTFWTSDTHSHDDLSTLLTQSLVTNSKIVNVSQIIDPF